METTISQVPSGASTYWWSAGYEGMESEMETTQLIRGFRIYGRFCSQQLSSSGLTEGVGHRIVIGASLAATTGIQPVISC